MTEDKREDLTQRDLEAGCDDVGDDGDSSLTPDDSMVEPISDKSLVEKTCELDDSADVESRGEGEGGEYERSSTLPIKDEKPDQTDRAAMQLNKYKKKFRSVLHSNALSDLYIRIS